MKTAIFNGKGNITVEDRPKPTVAEPTDAVVRVVMACVCGSDLWFYRGISELPHGSVGHEFIGVVDETGDGVKNVAVGDFVISPFSWSDGTCKNCEAGFHTACVHGGFFGQGGEGDGGQAEYVRVPQADGTLVDPRVGLLRRHDGLAACAQRRDEHRGPQRSALRSRPVTSSPWSATAQSGCQVSCRPRCSAPSASSCREHDRVPARAGSRVGRDRHHHRPW